MACDITGDKLTLEKLKESFTNKINEKSAQIKIIDALPVPDEQDLAEKRVYNSELSDYESCLKLINEKLLELEITGDNITTSSSTNLPETLPNPSFSETKNISNGDSESKASTVPAPTWTDTKEGEVSKNQNLISGYEVKDVAQLETIERSRGEQQNLDGKSLYTIPWDWRFGNSYTITQSVGNQMPAGPEWVGSPSIMNPFALIRFAHVAGNRHHVNLIDNAGKHDFRTGGLVRKQLTQEELQQQDPNKQSVPDGVSAISSEQELTQYGIPAGNYQDDQYGTVSSVRKDPNNGAIYLTYKDSSKFIWKPGKSGTNSSKGEKYKLPDDPLTVEVAAGATPDENFWLVRSGLKKCVGTDASSMIEGGELYVLDSGEDPCKEVVQSWGDVLKDTQKSKDVKDKQIQQYKDSAIQNWLQVKGQVERGWENTNESPTIEVPLLSDKMTSLDDAALEPTPDNLCHPASWKGKEQFIYKWSDFLYSTWFNKIPNNYMVTLRRFPNPIMDNGAIFGQSTSGNFVKPVAKAVTWLGEETGNTLSEILGLSWKMNWKDIDAQVNEIEGNELGAGADGSPFGGMASFLGRMNNVATGKGFSAASGWDEQRAKFDPYKDGAYANRVYGPVNVISKTKARDRGVESEHTMTLKFHYNLKSIGGINPKAAALDILANFLVLTYTQADFWGGANRYFPNKPQYPFPGGKKGFETWYSGDFEGFLDSMKTQLSQTVGNLANVLQDLFTNPAGALKSLLGGAAKTWMAEKQSKSRPAILAFKALLTGDPVGEWHVVVGNPFNPIAMFGNMIVTSAKVIFGERLGLDDFPTTMEFEVTLEHGRPRDRGDIESLFNRGEGRLYYAPFGQRVGAWDQTSSSKNSKIDTSWNKDGSSKGALSGTSLAKGYQNNSGGEVDSGIRTAIELGGESSAHATKLASQMGLESGPRKK